MRDPRAEDRPPSGVSEPNAPLEALIQDFHGNHWLVLDLLDQHRQNPLSVGESWRKYFQGIEAPGGPGGTREALEQQARLFQLIRAYRVRGHLMALLDPLGPLRPVPRELEPATYGFGPADLDQAFFTNGLANKEQATLREILEVLRSTYCRSVGAEYMFIQEFEPREWLQARMEACGNQTVSSKPRSCGRSG